MQAHTVAVRLCTAHSELKKIKLLEVEMGARAGDATDFNAKRGRRGSSVVHMLASRVLVTTLPLELSNFQDDVSISDGHRYPART